MHSQYVSLEHANIRLLVQWLEQWLKVKRCQIPMLVQSWMYIVCRKGSPSVIILICKLQPICGSTFYQISIQHFHMVRFKILPVHGSINKCLWFNRKPNVGIRFYHFMVAIFLSICYGEILTMYYRCYCLWYWETTNNVRQRDFCFIL